MLLVYTIFVTDSQGARDRSTRHAWHVCAILGTWSIRDMIQGMYYIMYALCDIFPDLPVILSRVHQPQYFCRSRVWSGQNDSFSNEHSTKLICQNKSLKVVRSSHMQSFHRMAKGLQEMFIWRGHRWWSARTIKSFAFFLKRNMRLSVTMTMCKPTTLLLTTFFPSPEVSLMRPGVVWIGNVKPCSHLCLPLTICLSK